MNQLLILLTLLFLTTACTEKVGDSTSTDSLNTVTSEMVSVDPTITSSNLNEDLSTNYINSEITNKLYTTTLITKPTEIFSDSLLQKSTGTTLFIGEHVTIENHSGTTLKNKWNEPVYKISYKGSDSNVKYGYISQSYIACRLDTLKSKKIVTLTLSYNISEGKFIGLISLLNNSGTILSNTNVQFNIQNESPPYTYSYYFSFTENESNGLEGITENFSISTDYDACGYVGYVYTFLWDEKKLINCPETFSIAEADLFHQHSYLLFPSDSLGKKGSILEIIESDEYGDINKNNTRKIHKDSTVIDHKWNNKSIAIPGDTIIKKSRTYSVHAEY